MKIQYMSDLHMEFQENSRYLKNNELPVTGDVLVLAGDIFYLMDKVAPLTKFWKWASENYRQVLIVPGNHEYYNYSDVMERGLQWRWMFRENVGYYQNQLVRIDDTDFVLITLWSRINPNDEYFVWKGMNDFRQIKFSGTLCRLMNSTGCMTTGCMIPVSVLSGKALRRARQPISWWLHTICRHSRQWLRIIRGPC